jgi:tripartite-type tricarboxylate transporter receptor subunit TctC
MRKLMIATVAGFLSIGCANAQDYPSRPITLIVPFAPGGGIDASARLQALHMSELLGQPIIVENVGAAGGQAGSARVAKSPPDGYTFMIGNSGTHAYSQALYKKADVQLRYRIPAGGSHDGVAAHPDHGKDLPVNNLKEFVAYTKSQPRQDAIRFGRCRLRAHLPCVLLNMAMDVNVTHVPYRGEGPVLQDVIGGRIDYMCATNSDQLGAGQGEDGEGHRRHGGRGCRSLRI